VNLHSGQRLGQVLHIVAITQQRHDRNASCSTSGMQHSGSVLPEPIACNRPGFGFGFEAASAEKRYGLICHFPFGDPGSCLVTSEQPPGKAS
jgi:hypothetical protein